MPDHACQGFRTKLDLVKSIYFNDVLMAEEDLVPTYEVVLFVGNESTERREGKGVEGIFVDCTRIKERTPLLDWLRALSTSSDAEAEVAKDGLLEYDEVRDVFNEE